MMEIAECFSIIFVYAYILVENEELPVQETDDARGSNIVIVLPGIERGERDRQYCGLYGGKLLLNCISINRELLVFLVYNSF